jgi:hypothetical protein
MKAISIQDMARVVDYLDKINDPLRTAYGNIRHKLIDIIVIAFTAVLCGYEDYEEMEKFGRLKIDCLRRVHTQSPLTGSRGSFRAGLLISSKIFWNCRTGHRMNRRFGGCCNVWTRGNRGKGWKTGLLT